MRFLIIALLWLAALPASAAAATMVVFDSCSEAALCNQLSITTTLNGNAIDVAITADPGYGIFGDSGANLAFGFNVGGSEVGLNFTNITSGFTLDGTDQNLGGGFGFFEYIIAGPHTGSDALLPLTFSVSRTSGFLSDLDLFETNSLGYIAAAHLRAPTGLTGFVAADLDGAGQQSVIPEPGTMLLLGTGLLAAARAARRRATP